MSLERDQGEVMGILEYQTMEFSRCINSSLGLLYPRKGADHMCTRKGIMTAVMDPKDGGGSWGPVCGLQTVCTITGVMSSWEFLQGERRQVVQQEG